MTIDENFSRQKTTLRSERGELNGHEIKAVVISAKVRHLKRAVHQHFLLIQAALLPVSSGKK